MEPSYVGDLIPSIHSYQKIIDQYERGLKKGEFHEEPIGEDQLIATPALDLILLLSSIELS